jgi:hypothetical protein
LIERLIPGTPSDVLSLRASFAAVVAKQWERHVPPAIGDVHVGAKARFIAGMYARACYSMLLVSARGPLTLRAPIRIAAHLPVSRPAAVRCGRGLLSCLDRLVPRTIHRQLALISTLMGVMDVVLDEAAPEGLDAVLSIASMRSPGVLSTLARSIRAGESAWQARYWDEVLLPATKDYCVAEALAVSNMPDPTGLGHRRAGIEAAIKGMWYVVGPCMGLHDGFTRPQWNREQQWMADTTLLMQMIDDWVDQDEDQGTRPTPVIEGTWGPQTIQALYTRTTSDLDALLEESGIQNKVFKNLIGDLYTDYLYTAVEAMQSGLAA